MEPIHGDAVLGGEMDAEQAVLGPLAQCHDMVLAAIGAQVDGVALGYNRVESPDALIEGDGLVEILDAELDAAQPGHLSVVHSLPLACGGSRCHHSLSVRLVRTAKPHISAAQPRYALS